MSGADLFVHGSNLILLLAYTRREMLSLRILALAAALTIVPYYALQTEVLWPPIFWSLVYAAVHSYHILALLRERRPIRFSDDEDRLWKMSFPSLLPHEFERVRRLVEWSELREGTAIELSSVDVLLLFEGRVAIFRAGAEVASLHPGQLIGIAFQLEGAPAWLECAAATTARIVRLSRADLETEMERSASIDAAVNSLLNHDLAAKVMRLVDEVASGTRRPAEPGDGVRP